MSETKPKTPSMGEAAGTMMVAGTLAGLLSLNYTVAEQDARKYVSDLNNGTRLEVRQGSTWMPVNMRTREALVRWLSDQRGPVPVKRDGKESEMPPAKLQMVLDVMGQQPAVQVRDAQALGRQQMDMRKR